MAFRGLPLIFWVPASHTQCHTVTGAVDVSSFGIVLWEMYPFILFNLFYFILFFLKGSASGSWVRIPSGADFFFFIISFTFLSFLFDFRTDGGKEGTIPLGAPICLLNMVR